MSLHVRPAVRSGLAVLAIVLVHACGAFEARGNEFPDAGPDGPDSLYAGVGQGIPFGEFGLSPEQFGKPATGAVIGVSRSNVGSVLTVASERKVRLVLNLGGAGDNYRNGDGTFNLERWKSRIDAYRNVDFARYVTQGLVLAHFLMDEPGAPRTWGGREVSRADVEEMARYSKSIWPTLPTVVRAPPGWLLAGDTTYAYLDIAWAQWSGPSRGAGSGRTPEEFRDENVAKAKALKLGLVFGLNYLNGGDGSSGIQGTADHPELWQMSASELLGTGPLLAETPYSCAFLSWRHEPAFAGRPEIRAALDSLARVAALRGGTSCLRRDSTAT